MSYAYLFKYIIIGDTGERGQAVLVVLMGRPPREGGAGARARPLA